MEVVVIVVVVVVVDHAVVSVEINFLASFQCGVQASCSGRSDDKPASLVVHLNEGGWKFKGRQRDSRTEIKSTDQLHCLHLTAPYLMVTIILNKGNIDIYKKNQTTSLLFNSISAPKDERL